VHVMQVTDVHDISDIIQVDHVSVMQVTNVCTITGIIQVDHVSVMQVTNVRTITGIIQIDHVSVMQVTNVCDITDVIQVDHVGMCIMQVTLGGLDDIYTLKNARRIEAGLTPLTEDTHEVCKHMRASSPPASAADLIDQHQQIRRTFRAAKKVRVTV